MGGKGESLCQAERDAAQRLETELRQHIDLTWLAFDTINVAVSSMPDAPVPQVPLSRMVATNLVNRLSNDLRCAALLASGGYALQACSLVACMYEVAYTIAAIGSDDSLARQWCEHDDPTSLFKPVKTLTRDALTKMGCPDCEKQVSIEYRVYRRLCMAKHANPILQQQHGLQVSENETVAFNGPDTSKEAVRAACFALEHGAGLAYVALFSFVTNHVPELHRAGLLDEIDKIGRTRKRLEAQAKERWGTDDPFKGKWRT